MYKNSHGFTLLELTISIGIFMMIGGMVMVNFRAGQYSDELQAGAKAVENAVREAQAAAIGGQEVCNTVPKSAPLGGFGLNISADNSIALWFGDCNYNDAPPADNNYKYNLSTTDVVVQNIDLGSNVIIFEKKKDNNVSAGILDLIFTSGSEVSKIDGFDGGTVNGANSVTVTLKHRKTLKTKTVKINLLSGQVFIE
ncbi:MAG: prepilin-type N-terminal cleavage/methylation domain-containing protein [Patescibacteria group bacterium]